MMTIPMTMITIATKTPAGTTRASPASDWATPAAGVVTGPDKLISLPPSPSVGSRVVGTGVVGAGVGAVVVSAEVGAVVVGAVVGAVVGSGVGARVGAGVGGTVDGGCDPSDGQTTPSSQLPWAGNRDWSPSCAPQAQHGVQKYPGESDPAAYPSPQNRRCTVSATSG